MELNKQEVRRRKGEIPALFWLVKTLKISGKELNMVLEELRSGGRLYETKFVRKRSGGKRELNIPSPLLKKIQRKINKEILSSFPMAKNVYGFSGGNIFDAIKPHLKAKSILMLDIRNAFPSVSSLMIFDFLTEGRQIKYLDYAASQTKYFWYGPYHKAISEFTPGFMSWYAARIITELTAHKNQLPQGAPTSPRFFDIFFKPLDERLSKFAEKIGAKYTRYADNLIFSMPTEEFPKPIKNGVSHRIRKEGFAPHKIKTIKMGAEAIRILGVNLINNEIHNTRDFKKALRLSIHHVNWFLDSKKTDDPGFIKARLKLKGQMNFARADTLPQKLLDDYLKLQKKLKESSD